MYARIRSVVVTGSLVLAAMSPATVMAQPEAPTGAPGLEGTTWQLTTLAGAADQAAVLTVGADLILSGGTASGFGGCNQFEQQAFRSVELAGAFELTDVICIRGVVLAPDVACRWHGIS